MKSFGVLFFSPALTEHLFYFKVDILAQIGCVESLSQSPPSSSSPSPSSSINKVKFKLECKRKEPFKTFFPVRSLFWVKCLTKLLLGPEEHLELQGQQGLGARTGAGRGRGRGRLRWVDRRREGAELAESREEAPRGLKP